MTAESPDNSENAATIAHLRKLNEQLVDYIDRLEAKIGERVDVLEKSLDQQETRITKRLASTESSAPAAAAPKPVRWEELDPIASREMMQGVANFVELLVTRHGMQQHLQRCWFRHPAAIEELSALMTARDVAFAPNSDASMASWWQDLLERSQIRLRRMFIKCRQGHSPTESTTWLDDEYREAFRSFLGGAQLRSPGTEPIPRR